MKKGYVLWFTGLSGSGKTTLAKGLEKILKRKYSVQIIDGDEFRNKVHPELRFSPEEIITNNEKIIKYCQEKLKEKDFLLVPVIAPFNSTRLMARKMLKNYLEIFCKASLKTCIERDPKGLYRKALTGEIENFIGIHKNVPYQIPKHPDLVVNTGLLNRKKSLEKVLVFLKSRNIDEQI